MIAHSVFPFISLPPGDVFFSVFGLPAALATGPPPPPPTKPPYTFCPCSPPPPHRFVNLPCAHVIPPPCSQDSSCPPLLTSWRLTCRTRFFLFQLASRVSVPRQAVRGSVSLPLGQICLETYLPPGSSPSFWQLPFKTVCTRTCTH